MSSLLEPPPNDTSFPGWLDGATEARRPVAVRKPASLGAEQQGYLRLKRALDILLVLLASPLILAICLVLALVIRATSSGPILFCHRRIGKSGRFFSMWKFRSMRVDAAELLEAHFQQHPMARREWMETHKLQNDPRVTPVGRFLRRTSLDELPQVWNVLNGTMSLVGPRPIVTAEVAKYGSEYFYYCAARPGLTGLWQVSGRSKLTYDQRVELDRKYVVHCSLLGDVGILFRTLRCVVEKDGAY